MFCVNSMGRCLFEKQNENFTGAFCRKCTEQKGSVLLQRKFPYCRDCFLAYFCHKYYGGLGKSRILKTSDRIMLAFCGKPSSVCLLNLMKIYILEEKLEKVKFDVDVLYIDEMLNSSFKERSAVYSSFIRHLNKYSGYKIHFTLLNIDNDITLFQQLDVDKDYCSFKENIKKVFEAINSQTSRIDFLKRLRYNILIKAAYKLNCNKIFTAETSDDVATIFFSNVALGRGKHLSQDIAFTYEPRIDGLVIVRPLTNCSRKEVIFYNIFTKLGFLNTARKEASDIDKFSSVQNMTESFINELQLSYPSTVSTVVSLGRKLDCNHSTEEVMHCLVCKAQLEGDIKELSALQAIKISSIVSAVGPKCIKAENYVLRSERASPSGVCLSERNGLSLELYIRKYLCYGCRLILQDTKSLSAWLCLIKATKDTIFREMQNEIQSYLL